MYIQDPTFHIIRMLILGTLSFLVAFFLTPVLTHFLYKYRLTKSIRDEGKTPVFTSLHEKKRGTPTMGGVLIWVTALVLAVGFWILAGVTENPLLKFLNFVSRSQTLLPLGVLVASAVVGLGDDLIGIWGSASGKKGMGLRMRHRIILYTAIAVVGAWWFFFKLDWTTLHIPLIGNYDIGIWYIPLFIFIIFATAFSVNETDGLDGLAGGVLMVAFASYGVIAFALGRYDLAVFSAVIMGALLAFLWFNVYPARFFMGDTGAMSLGVTLGVIAMLTNYALLLPFIAFILVMESTSVLMQLGSRRILKRRLFFSTPLHHHFEARGWPETKVTMRFWIISGVMAGVGLIIFLLDRLN